MTGRVSDGLIDPADGAARNIEKLLTIADALMRHAEQEQDGRHAAYEEFRRAAELEERVRQRTRDLEATLRQLNDANATAERARRDLSEAIEAIEEGFALFDADQTLVRFNSKFCAEIADVRPVLTPGLAFAEYVLAVSRSPVLALPEGMSRAAWVGERMRHHIPGQVFNVGLVGDRWLQVSEQRTADGGTVVLQTNVTEIIRAERSERGKLLDDQARMIRATLDHINQGVGIFDADRRLAGWNWRFAQMLEIRAPLLRRGMAFEAVAGRIVDRAGPGEAAETPVALLDWVRSGERRAPLSLELRHGSGVVLDLHAQEMPGRGFVMSLTDVTRERQAIHAMLRANSTLEARVAARTEELAAALAHAERANSARVRFVAAASHDLLQPLSAAKLFVAAARDEAGAAALPLEKAHNALMSVEAILGALLDISRLESGGREIEIAPVRLSRLLAQLTDEFAPLAARKGLRLTILPCAAAVSSDATYLRRILQNLIGNAVRYTATGRVLVGARRMRGAVRLEVHDTGPGIAPEEQEAIFREFHRIEGTASAAEGMGLGLAIVERACAILHHRLSLRSRPGIGTCFAVELPLAAGMPCAARAPVPLGEDMAGGRIALLVENDEDLRRAMALLLERRGVDVLEAASGAEAVDLLAEIGIVPDLYLLDHQLGEGMTGVETAVALHRRFGPRPTRIVTADRSPATRAAAAAAGLEIIFKPIDPETLEAFVRQGV